MVKVETKSGGEKGLNSKKPFYSHIKIGGKFGSRLQFNNVDSDFGFIEVRGRREFFDMIKDYIKEKRRVSREKISAYFQYRTGASLSAVYNALDVLVNLGFIRKSEQEASPSFYYTFYEYVFDKKE